jgi:branched-chain amino acid transport system substrate-binding protein
VRKKSVSAAALHVRAGARMVGTAGAIVFAAALVAACGSGGGGASTAGASNTGVSSGSTAGVSSKSVLVGLITSLSGPNAPQVATCQPGVEARIDQQNAAGGVAGRQIHLVVADDQSTPTGALTAAQTLVEQKHVFGIISCSGVLFGASSYLTRTNVPVTGTGIDGTEWGDPQTPNMFDASGAPSASGVFSEWGQFFKSQGASRIAEEIYGTIPSTVAQGKNVSGSVRAAGLTNVLEDTSVNVTDTDLTPQVLKLKAAKADGVYLPLANTQVLALTTELKQNHVPMKVVLVQEGFGDLAGAGLAASDGDDYPLPIATADFHNAAAAALLATVHRYTSYKKPEVDGFVQLGWLGADLMITGLKAAGQELSADSFENKLHAVSDYNAGGLGAGVVNLKQSLQGTYGTLPEFGDCFFVMQSTGSASSYKPLNNGRPYCGKALPQG